MIAPGQDTQSAYVGHAGRQEGRSGDGDALPWKGHDMRLMAARRLRRRRGLAALSDEALYALLARIETILLDRPHSGCHLAVEVLHDHEARLLATYRALPEERRWEALALAEQYRATSREHRDTRQRAGVYQGQRARTSRTG
jgi:hypothetical protein